MLFGARGNPWQGRSWGQQPAQQHPAYSQQPVMQPQVQPNVQPLGFTPPQAQWAAPTPDMAYANQLAQYYGAQMPQQQVPGSSPLVQGPSAAPPVGQPAFGMDWRNAFRAAKDEWRGERPEDRALRDQWRAAKPQRSDFRQ